MTDGDQSSRSVAPRDQWENAVAGVLAKSRRVNTSDIAMPASAHLAQLTYDDITIDPLYDRTTEGDQQALPGHFPFTRGRDGGRDTLRGWHVCARFGGSDAATVNERILTALGTGATSLWLDPITGGADELAGALDGVLVDLAPIRLNAGADTVNYTTALLEVVGDNDAQIAVGAQPLTAQFAGSASIDMESMLALMPCAIAHRATIRSITVDGSAFHDAGAADAQEVGFAVAAGLEYVRAAADAGITIADALTQIEFRLVATDEQFETIAKFRAARRVWARIAEELGYPGSGSAPQHAVTSRAMMTRRDPWVNMLRTTVAALAAGIGGADEVTVATLDDALDATAGLVSATFADRMAINTQLLLLEESHLGRVMDPGGGSWHVEALTDAMATAAWVTLQRVERAGGYRAALSVGDIAADISDTRKRRDADIAHRRKALTGVSEFPNLAEKPAAHATPDSVHRYSDSFDALRDRSDSFFATTGRRPTVTLAPLGPISEYNTRASFVTNLMAAGGIEAVDPGPTENLADMAGVATTDTAIICGTDKRYATEVGPAVATLRSAGIRHVLLAGRASSVAELAETETPDGCIGAGVDAIELLTELLDSLIDGSDGSTGAAATPTNAARQGN